MGCNRFCCDLFGAGPCMVDVYAVNHKINFICFSSSDFNFEFVVLVAKKTIL